MKCIEVNGKKGIKIIRVSDKQASDLVDVGRAKYTSKEEWKREGRGENES